MLIPLRSFKLKRFRPSRLQAVGAGGILVLGAGAILVFQLTRGDGRPRGGGDDLPDKVRRNQDSSLSPIKIGGEVSGASCLLLPERARLANEKDEFVEEVGIEGMTDLHVAAGLNLSVLTQFLLDQGADVHVEDAKLHTPLHYAAWKNASGAAAVLLKNGADVRARDDKGTAPLQSAALGDAMKTAQILLDNGADLNVRDERGSTPLHYASDGNAPETAAVLLERGADVHAKDEEGWTPLHLAARSDASETAKVLLNYGADVRAKGRDDVTALQISRVFETSGTAEILRDHLTNSILDTGDGSRERPYVVSSIKEEYLILEHFNKTRTIQGLMHIDGKAMDYIGCEDGTTYYFDISQAREGRLAR